MIFLHIIRTLNNQGWLCLIKMSSCKHQHDRNISKKRRGHFLYYSSPPGGNRWRFDSPAGDTDLYLPQSWETHSNLEHLQLFYNVLINRTHPLHNPSQFSIICIVSFTVQKPRPWPWSEQQWQEELPLTGTVSRIWLISGNVPAGRVIVFRNSYAHTLPHAHTLDYL